MLCILFFIMLFYYVVFFTACMQRSVLGSENRSENRNYTWYRFLYIFVALTASKILQSWVESRREGFIAYTLCWWYGVKWRTFCSALVIGLVMVCRLMNEFFQWRHSIDYKILLTIIKWLIMTLRDIEWCAGKFWIMFSKDN